MNSYQNTEENTHTIVVVMASTIEAMKYQIIELENENTRLSRTIYEQGQELTQVISGHNKEVRRIDRECANELRKANNRAEMHEAKEVELINEVEIKSKNINTLKLKIEVMQKIESSHIKEVKKLKQKIAKLKKRLGKK